MNLARGLMLRVPRAMLLALVLLAASLAGCFGDDSLTAEPYGVPGGLALACLRADEFTKLVIEIDYEADHKPRPETTDMLVQRLSSVCDKTSVTFELWLTDFEQDATWTDDEIRSIGRTSRASDAMNGDELRFHLMFPAGSHTREGVLGSAVDASTAMIFIDDVKAAENMLQRPSWEKMEAAVTVHEVGHLLGLVNLVYTSTIDHEDSSNSGHSSNDESVMYWAVESTDPANVIFGTVPNDFDDDDRADLAALASGELEAEDQL